MHSLRLKRSVEKCNPSSPTRLVLVGVEYTCGRNEMKDFFLLLLKTDVSTTEKRSMVVFLFFSAYADSFLTGFSSEGHKRPSHFVYSRWVYVSVMSANVRPPCYISRELLVKGTEAHLECFDQNPGSCTVHRKDRCRVSYFSRPTDG